MTSAEMNMSAAAPFSIWRARVELAAKENFTGTEVSFVKASPRSCSTFVSEDAAKTVIAGVSASADQLGSPSNAQRTNITAAALFIYGHPTGQVNVAVVSSFRD